MIRLREATTREKQETRIGNIPRNIRPGIDQKTREVVGGGVTPAPKESRVLD
jgi:hypothetical protein